VTRFVAKKTRRTVYAVRATNQRVRGRAAKSSPAQRRANAKNSSDVGARQQHLTFPNHFCACKGFTWDVVSRDEKLMCKHMLAAALAECVDGCDEVEVDDVVFANMLAKEMME
jgi:predicted nucleic acid-binding Zn finger protein